MAGSRAREGSDGFQHQGSGGVIKRNLPRQFVDEANRLLDRQGTARSGFLRGGGGGGRKASAIVRSVLPYMLATCAVGGFILLATLLHRATEDGGIRNRRWNGGHTWEEGKGSRTGSVVRFLPSDILRRFDEQGGLDRIRSELRVGVRLPRLAIVLGTMEKDSPSLLLFTLVKSFKELGYHLTVFALKDGKARPHWEQIGGQISMLNRDSYVDWSIFEGVILSSLEARITISSLMQEPFDYVPVIWIIQEGVLGERLSLYKEMGRQLIISEWRKAFNRADIVVFPDSSLPMLYTALDAGNFFVVSGSPVDVWAAESYASSHSKIQLRRDDGFDEDDLVVVVIGGSVVYGNDPWDYVAAMHLIGPSLLQFAYLKHHGKSFKVLLLSGKSTDGHGSTFQDSDIASRFGFPKGCVKHYGLDGNVNKALLIADIVLYVSFHDEQTFPPLLARAMSFGVLVVAPDLTVIKRYVTNEVDGFIFQSSDPKSFSTIFSLAIAEINAFNRTVATSGKLLSRNMLAQDCIIGYAKLLENVVQFPSDTVLPGPSSKLQLNKWEWDFLEGETEPIHRQVFSETSSIVYIIEEELADKSISEDTFTNQSETLVFDYPSDSDWEDVREMEFSEDIETLEIQELAERTERPSESWEDVYSKSRKASKRKFGDDERDDEELEKVGQYVSIYEIYGGAGAWPFLHHSALYRAVSLSKDAKESRVDDVRAVLRLSFLNITYYRDLLCEYGGMLAIANKSNSIHKTPWIGFQSWRAAGRKVSLTIEAERTLEQTLRTETEGDVFYYWARADLGTKDTKGNYTYDFWSICDILNNGHCRDVFEDAFRLMYGIPSGVSALPPMPSSGHWSALNSWVMPTPSFLEFIMFSRMFLDSLDSLNSNSSVPNSCLLGSSKLEKKQCYCRVLELLVNVWAYHSARKMVYLDPQSGKVREQHPVEQRRGLMWLKYFDFALLRSMDEDLAEATEDRVYPRKGFLWPLTGEVYCQLIQEKEKELRYRLKREKSRKDKEKQLERKRNGRIQKPLG
ncbi:unnamed protein product [Spirodela intermedia]|uniref:Uncharacterized protein n=1 Tax=Spirodela intermedia TaxID=51605 RepID=A0A7I8K1N2_SPIIN|nr:unnamed protein product [Spirodela intermedia]